jgi:hypothetical protein
MSQPQPRSLVQYQTIQDPTVLQCPYIRPSSSDSTYDSLLDVLRPVQCSLSRSGYFRLDRIDRSPVDHGIKGSNNHHLKPHQSDA